MKFEVTSGANPALRYASQNGTLPLTLVDPQVTFFPQGRYTNTYQFNDNASWMLGNHSLQVGGSYQRIHVNPYNYEGTVPTVSFGFSSAAPSSVQLNASMFPGGISSVNLSSANTMLALLSGTLTSVTRTFQVQDQTSGYVPGIPNDRNYTLNNIAAYAQDSWRVRSNVTVRAGLKWEYYSPVSEDANLAFLPQLNGRNYLDVLRDSNTTISFVDGGMWNSNKLNIGPTIGVNFYDLPFGKGRKYLSNQNGWVDCIVGGWQLSGILHWQSGSPVGLYSTRGTFNRAGRSGANTAYTTLSMDEMKNLFKVTKAANGNIYWIDPSVIGPDGRAVGADNLGNTAGFAGQVFFNPVAGQVGNLPILAFMAPSVWQLDASLAKRFNIVGSKNFEFRMEAFNVLNSVSFYTGDYNVNSTTFGRLTGTGNSARVVQFTFRFTF